MLWISACSVTCGCYHALKSHGILVESITNQDFEIRTQKFGVGYLLIGTLLPLSATLCVYIYSPLSL